jgi:hypothetical protein
VDNGSKVAIALFLLGGLTWLADLLFSEDIKKVSRNARIWVFLLGLAWVACGLLVLFLWPVSKPASAATTVQSGIATGTAGEGIHNGPTTNYITPPAPSPRATPRPKSQSRSSSTSADPRSHNHRKIATDSNKPGMPSQPMQAPAPSASPLVGNVNGNAQVTGTNNGTMTQTNPQH